VCVLTERPINHGGIHYFLSYKDMPGTSDRRVEITHIYSAEEARQVVRLSIEDYRVTFG
jgi:inorganic pyrophosphatase